MRDRNLFVISLLILFLSIVGIQDSVFAFRAPEENWSATQEPGLWHQNYSLSVELGSYDMAKEDIILSLKEYLLSHADLLKGLSLEQDLELDYVADTPSMVYVQFIQQIPLENLRISGSQVHFSIKRLKGRCVLMFISLQVFPEVKTFLPPAKNQSPAITREKATEVLGISKGAIPLKEQYLVRYLEGKWRRVYEANFKESRFTGVVDTDTNESWLRDDRLYEQQSSDLLSPSSLISGDVWARGVLFDPLNTGDNLDYFFLADLKVTNTGNGDFVYTDSSGNFGFTVSGHSPRNLFAELLGRWSDVTVVQGTDLSITQSVEPDIFTTLQFNPAGNIEYDTAQVNAYYHTSLVHNWVKERIPSLSGIDFSIPTNVNLNDACNAYYANPAPSINFFASGAGCINTAFDTVIYHEYGHFVDDMAGGITYSNPTIALSEGWGDILSAFATNQPITGEGFFGAGTFVRTADNNYQFPSGGSDEPHALGQAWAGFAWHLRENFKNRLGEVQGIALSEELIIPVFLANSQDIPSAVREVLILDDDDGDLSNATPNYADILSASQRHSLDFALYADLPINVAPVYGWPGDVITITGSNFGDSPGSVKFNGVPATPISWNDSSITVAVPSAATSGNIVVQQANLISRYPVYFNVVYAYPSIISIAGGGFVFPANRSGDGSVATSAVLNSPNAVAVEASGNVYIADTDNNRIRKIDTSGIITTVAGTGVAGYSGDGMAAVSAKVKYPSGIAVDNAGNIYVGDTDNHRIRKINSAGIITTVVGTGVAGYSGDSGPATSAKVYHPKGIAFDSLGNMYFADMYNNRIRKVNTSGIITTFAGDGSYSMGGDGGPATSAKFRNPYYVAVDQSGNVYISDKGNFRVRKVDASGIINTVAGTGAAGYNGDNIPATTATVKPFGLATDNLGNFYIADFGSNRIRKVNSSGIITTVVGNGYGGFSGDGGLKTSAMLGAPTDVFVTNSGKIYIADRNNNRIRMAFPDDTTLPTVSITSPADGITVRGVIAITANASDDIRLRGVQFRLGSQNIGAEDTAPPYKIYWNSASVSNGSYILTAKATDSAGNTATSQPITIIVYNSPPKPIPTTFPE